MGEVKPLTLKRQKATNRPRPSTQDEEGALQIEVQLDTGVFHLDQSFSYLVPSELTTKIHLGSLVLVPFREDLKIGIVVGIGGKKGVNLLKIEKLLVEHGFSQGYLEFLEKLASRYITTTGQIQKYLTSLLDVKGANLSSIPFQKAAAHSGAPKFISLALGQDSLLIIDYLAKRNEGSRIVIFPTERELVRFRANLIESYTGEVIEFGSHLTLSQRKSAMRSILSSSEVLVIGLRSAIFAPVRNLAEIIVVDEFSSHYHERRAPHWNLRDAALLRSESEGCELSFAGNSASLELYRLIDSKWIKIIQLNSANKQRYLVDTLPNTFHATIREGLKQGPVLVSVSVKDYSPGFICKRCRNRAVCDSGHPLILQSRTQIACSVCDRSITDWRCPECGNNEIYTFKAGASRVKEEIGKAFPRTDVFISTADKPLLELPKGSCIVISTPGVEPVGESGYGAIVMLDGEELSARSIVRAEEELFQRWSKSLSMLGENGRIYLSLSKNHPIAQAIAANKMQLFTASALRDRQQVNLPPYTRVIQIQGEVRALSALRIRLAESFPDGLSIYTSHSGGRLTLQANHELMPELQRALKALQKLRSAGGKELLRIVVDPIEF